MLGWLKSQVWLACSSQSQCGILVLKTKHHNKQGLRSTIQNPERLSNLMPNPGPGPLSLGLNLTRCSNWRWTIANWTIVQCLKLPMRCSLKLAALIAVDYDLLYSSFLQLKLVGLITRLLAKCRFSITRHLEISVPQSNDHKWETSSLCL